MTDDTDKTVDIDDTNLDEFEKDFFNTEPKAEVEAEEASEEVVEEGVEEAVDETEDDSLATDDDEDEDADEVEEDNEDEKEIVEVPQPKAKRNRAQERIEQLLERERLANDRAHALELRLAALEAGKEVVDEKVPNIRDQLSADAPNPDAKDKDGEPLYELGEFDPKFIRDLTRFTIGQEMKEAEESRKTSEREALVKAAQEEIRTKWEDNLEKAEAELPEIRDNIRDLTETFADLDPGYGEYLASTIMNMDSGPSIMNYLSQNIGEAQKIVASGPAAATLALGRLDARLTKTPIQQEEKRNRQVSKASEPPVTQARGHGGKFTVADDTEDLDAFEKKFFNG